MCKVNFPPLYPYDCVEEPQWMLAFVKSPAFVSKDNKDGIARNSDAFNSDYQILPNIE
jgi:hypothetical protein